MNAEATTPSKGLKITVIILRTLMGLLFLFSAAYYFFKLPVPPLTGDMKTFNDGLMASHYLLPVAKSVELVCGLAFVSGRFVSLAAVLIAPIIVNIALIAVFLGHEGLPFAVLLVVANGLTAYYHRDRYAPLFRAK
ncbi:MAG TPA: DoxX family membrane protein [Holophagaceae bacterium]|nr:DoxX family membrane protein [Holophagaceae bacterium]